MFDLSVFTSASGRISRQTWWLANIVLYVILFALVFIVSLLTNNDSSGVVSIFILLIELVFVAAAITVSVKRLHDLDKSGWYYLIALIPFIGGLILFIQCGFIKGTVGPNKYGNDPTQSAEFNANYSLNTEGVPAPKSGTSTAVIIGIVVGVFCLLPVIVIAVLTIMGPLVKDVFETINASL